MGLHLSPSLGIRETNLLFSLGYSSPHLQVGPELGEAMEPLLPHARRALLTGRVQRWESWRPLVTAALCKHLPVRRQEDRGAGSPGRGDCRCLAGDTGWCGMLSTFLQEAEHRWGADPSAPRNCLLLSVKSS